MSNPIVPVRRSSILDEYEVFRVLLHLRQQPLTNHVEVRYSSHCVFMGEKNGPYTFVRDTTQKTLTFGEPAHTAPVPLGFLFPIYARFVR